MLKKHLSSINMKTDLQAKQTAEKEVLTSSQTPLENIENLILFHFGTYGKYTTKLTTQLHRPTGVLVWKDVIKEKP